MSSVYSADDRPPEDLTARARIRDAALAQFAERGFRGATLKGIARAAGVSVGLVQHHFGSKDELQRTCDSYATETLARLDTYGVPGGEINDPDFVAGLLDRGPLIIRYVARAMVEGSEAAAAFFDAGADATEQFLSRTWPDRFPAGSPRTRDAATVMAAMHTATIALHEHLSRRMGVDVLARENSARIGPAMLDIYAAMAEFADSTAGESIREAAARHQRDTPHPSTEGQDGSENE